MRSRAAGYHTLDCPELKKNDALTALACASRSPQAPREGFRAKVAMDIRRYAEREGVVVTAPLVLRLFLLTQGFQFVLCRRVQDGLIHVPIVGRSLRRVWWWMTCIAFSSEIAIACRIGGGLYIPHPYGIVLGVCDVGENVTILQNVTVGARAPNEKGCATIGSGVYLSPGAVLLGAIKIGEQAVIGANAVVMHNVPDGAVAVGVPARIVS